MNSLLSVVGIDPGPSTGLCFLDYFDTCASCPQVTLLQVDGHSADAVLEAMLARWYHLANDTITGRFAAVEKFVTGRGAGTKGNNAEVTRQLVMELTERLQLHGYQTKIRSAAGVKPWATDKRLERAGITGQATSMRHALDAGRHALFAAVEDANMRDPLA